MSPAMTPPKRLRIAALCAVLALALHGAAALVHQHGPDLDRDCVLCHLGHLHVLQSDPPGASPALTPAGHVAEEPGRPAQEAALSLHLSRGPPA
jgi:hypothetical protein